MCLDKSGKGFTKIDYTCCSSRNGKTRDWASIPFADDEFVGESLWRRPNAMRCGYGVGEIEKDGRISRPKGIPLVLDASAVFPWLDC